MTESDDVSSVSLDFLPENLRRKLMPFQKEGVMFGIRKNGRCLIADEMGLGKTIQALALAYYYRSEWPVLVVVPSSLCYPWVEEVEKWFPEILPEDINVIENGLDVGKISSSLMTIVTYGLIRHSSSHLVQEALVNKKFKVVIVDESHYIKNHNAVSTKYIVPLVQGAQRRILLTGTPALNCPKELFSQLEAVLPGEFGNWTRFAKHYCDAKFKFFGRQRRWTADGASNLEELQSRLSGMVMIRRLKKNVLTQLPPKCRQKIMFRLKDSDLKKELDGLLDELETVLRQNNTTMEQAFQRDGASDRTNSDGATGIYSCMQRLSMKTCAAKIGPVKEYVRLLCENKELKFIIFTYHRAMTSAIVEQLIESKVKFIRIDGATIVADRPYLVSQFQNDETTHVAVLSIQAAGVGLTLTAASLVVFAELNWTPGVLEQCEDRAHRIGQKDTVNVQYLVAAGSIDEWVWASLSRKTTVVSTVLNGEKKYLRMGRGTSDQIRCLANADVYVAADNSSVDLACLLQTQIGQTTVRDYFSSSERDSSSPVFCSTPKASKISSDIHVSDGLHRTPSSSKQISEDSVIVVESDDDEVNAFDEAAWWKRQRTPYAHSNKKRKRTSGSTTRRKTKQPPQTPKGPGKCLAMDRVENSWSCEACTFLNLSVIPSCEMCLTPRHKRPRQSNQLISDNDVHAETCEIDCVRRASLSENSENTDIHHKGFRSSDNRFVNSDSAVKENQMTDLDEFSDKNMNSLGDEMVLRKKKHISEDAVVETDQLSEFDGPRVSKSRNWSADKVSGAVNSDLDEIEDMIAPKSQCFVTPDLPTCLTTDVRDSMCDESDSEGLFEACCSYLSNIDEDLEKSPGIEEVPTDRGNKEEDEDRSVIMEESDCLERTLESTKDFDEEKAEDSSSAASCNTGKELQLDADAGQFLEERPDEVVNDVTLHDLDDIQVHSLFQFSCSQYTSRVYVYDQTGAPLYISFIPLDMEMENLSEFPKVLLHPHHLQLIRRFVRDWKRLSQTKRRLIVKSGLLFVNPSAVYDQIKSGHVPSKQRYGTKTSISAVSVSKAIESGGSLRVINRTNGTSKEISLTDDSSAAADITNMLLGYVQAVDGEGNPLCLNCQSVFKSSIVTKATLTKYSWQTRLCSQTCFHEFLTKHNRSYGIRQVYNLEHGICQLCSFDAHQFYINIKSISSLETRAKMIQDSKYSALTTDYKEKMIRQPSDGLFWNVDHILPVSEGGGECNIDNLRTLCTVCHRDVTRQQNKDRPKLRLREAAATCQNIKNFFRPLK